MRVIKFEYLFENIQEDGRSIVKQNWTLQQIESNELIYEKQILIAKRQYTGLKDKNNVEIYEGDIVKSVAGLAYIEIVCIGKVEFNYSSWVLTYKDEKFYDGIGYVTFDHLAENNCSLEVIGNIYENKDLLSEVK